MTTQHNKPRIKFQNNYANKFETDDLVPLSIEDNPTILANNLTFLQKICKKLLIGL